MKNNILKRLHKIKKLQKAEDDDFKIIYYKSTKIVK